MQDSLLVMLRKGDILSGVWNDWRRLESLEIMNYNVVISLLNTNAPSLLKVADG